MKRHKQVKRTSIIVTIEFMMEQSGINRQQATIAFNTIIHYIKAHPSEPIGELIVYLFGAHKNEEKGQLN